MTELNESLDQTMKAMELKKLAEDDVTRLKLISQAAEIEKQTLQQQVQSLIDMGEYFRNTTTNSVNEFVNKLKLDLNLSTDR